ncbi:MAG: M48 family metalloprotease [Leptospiraceae bacterium]|nr:M48 family metalloprotease [Leptospiraceae bacterium]
MIRTFIIIFHICNFSLLAEKILGYKKALSNYILNLSEMEYKNYKESNTVLNNYKDWKSILDRTFYRLAQSSGLSNFKIEYSIIKNPSFNAYVYPGGQFILHTGTLDAIDKEIKKQKENGLEHNTYREFYISGILAHELAHYYNRHTFKLYMKKYSFSKSSTSNSLSLIKFGQDLELDADKTGYVLLGKAGYDTSYFLKILKFLNKKYQENLKKGNHNPYFSSHPSPNRRLGKLSEKEKKFYIFADKMESAFADIQIGTNLKNALNEIENGLVRFKNNPDLLRAKAVALHKLWLESAEVEKLLLRSIIDLPSFRNDMLLKKLGTRDITKKIPGNLRFYYKAKKTYKKVISITKDPFFLSNYATLLSYSPNPRQEQKAESLARRAYEESRGNLVTGNNLGVVLYLIGKKRDALTIFEILASEANNKIKDLLSKTDDNAKEQINRMARDIKRMQTYNKRYVNRSFTSILNLALYHYYTDPKSMKARVVTALYLQYDKHSEWAKFLATGMNMEDQVAESKLVINMQTKIHEVGIGNSFKEVFEKWGNFSRTKNFGKKVYYYYDKHNAKIEFHDTIVTNIELSPGTDYKLNQAITPDIRENKVDEYFKKHAEIEGNYKTYLTNTGKVTIYSEKGIVKKLWLHK